ncbi:hypothetical protein ED733_006984 [Metarhizium rileyi]|uniref:Uncharacterized protein n=1 Tax=Metarhizium rileyi (strain RCEF 4871) TaxID=1649241 RepID=A0A5C6GP57_METRR|nr:hypothetical protein ED733_006984 [Metarhizium rileyi]
MAAISLERGVLGVPERRSSRTLSSARLHRRPRGPVLIAALSWYQDARAIGYGLEIDLDLSSTLLGWR